MRNLSLIPVLVLSTFLQQQTQVVEAQQINTAPPVAEAWICDQSFNPVSPKESTVPLIFGSKIIRICIQPDSQTRSNGIVLRAIDRFSFSKGERGKDGVQTVIAGGKVVSPGEATNISCQPGAALCSFQTILMEDFFYPPVFNDTEIAPTITAIQRIGAVSMEYGDAGGTRRALLRGTIQLQVSRRVQEGSLAGVNEIQVQDIRVAEQTRETVQAEEGEDNAFLIMWDGLPTWGQASCGIAVLLFVLLCGAAFGCCCIAAGPEIGCTRRMRREKKDDKLKYTQPQDASGHTTLHPADEDKSISSFKTAGNPSSNSLCPSSLKKGLSKNNKEIPQQPKSHSDANSDIFTLDSKRQTLPMDSDSRHQSNVQKKKHPSLFGRDFGLPRGSRPTTDDSNVIREPLQWRRHSSHGEKVDPPPRSSFPHSLRGKRMGLLDSVLAPGPDDPYSRNELTGAPLRRQTLHGDHNAGTKSQRKPLFILPGAKQQRPALRRHSSADGGNTAGQENVSNLPLGRHSVHGGSSMDQDASSRARQQQARRGGSARTTTPRQQHATPQNSDIFSSSASSGSFAKELLPTSRTTASSHIHHGLPKRRTSIDDVTTAAGAASSSNDVEEQKFESSKKTLLPRKHLPKRRTAIRVEEQPFESSKKTPPRKHLPKRLVPSLAADTGVVSASQSAAGPPNNNNKKKKHPPKKHAPRKSTFAAAIG